MTASLERVQGSGEMSISPSRSDGESLVETVAEIAYEVLLEEGIVEIHLTPKVHSLVCDGTLYSVRTEDRLIPKIEELVQKNSQKMSKKAWPTSSSSWVMYLILRGQFKSRVLLGDS